jgi:hypothetical protein
MCLPQRVWATAANNPTPTTPCGGGYRCTRALDLRGGVLPDPSCTGINRAFVERAQSMSGASWRSGRGCRLLGLSTQPLRNSLMEWSWCSRLADEGTSRAGECVVERVDDQDHPWLRYMATWRIYQGFEPDPCVTRVLPGKRRTVGVRRIFERRGWTFLSALGVATCRARLLNAPTSDAEDLICAVAAERSTADEDEQHDHGAFVEPPNVGRNAEGG